MAYMNTCLRTRAHINTARHTKILWSEGNVFKIKRFVFKDPEKSFMADKKAQSTSVNADVEAKLLETLQRNFQEVESIFYHNNVLIREISKNQKDVNVESSLAKNPVLIRELNNNIGQVVDLYANLPVQLSNSFQTAKRAPSGRGCALSSETNKATSSREVHGSTQKTENRQREN
ncbi:hypothetical protein KP509_02G019400 [Ceratopteris richardii]|uniref:Protein EARLY FLOWERING 4 domain-containing protein n=1 Tax=Ceratopteris richardii TaxID=49495 RepID=A0A8T2V3S2_CERRI|nr:hypothetical protein KP509_02G019400 [Ceratopteris richardii]KAH7443097.1 hypothetical protein KP509_02G019400 [Ceratopteris richardii]KAH7443098.1 hypothetical protein KP509_02G019400 [Ceratopteris richardii]